MQKRRQFLNVCVATATALAMPATGSILVQQDATGDCALDALKAMRGQRVSLREGGSVLVAEVKAIGADVRWEQCLVQMLPSAPLKSGIYHLKTPAGSHELYLEAGGNSVRPTVTAAFSRLRA